MMAILYLLRVVCRRAVGAWTRNSVPTKDANDDDGRHLYHIIIIV